MKNINGETFYTIGEVGTLLERSAQTIKHWYAWYEKQSEEFKNNNPLPEMITTLDLKGTRYFNEKDIPLLEKFKENINYGQMSEYNRNLWGKRGERIKKQKLRSV